LSVGAAAARAVRDEMMKKMDENLNNIVVNAIVLKIDTSSMKSVKKVQLEESVPDRWNCE
jgi:hypothetical protein